MDKNTIIGIGVIVAILIGFGLYNQPSDTQLAQIKRERDSLAIIERNRAINDELRRQSSTSSSTQNLTDASAPDSVKQAQLKKDFGSFATAANGTQEFITLENKKLRIKFSNRGGRIYSVELKDYRRVDSLPLLVFSGDSTEFGIGLSAIGKSTNMLFFKPQTTEKLIIANEKAQTITYRLASDSSHYIDYVYSLTPDDYQVRFEMKFHNMEQIITDQYLSMNWSMYMPQNEKGRQWEQQNSTINYQYVDDEENDKLSPTTTDVESEKMTGRVHWFAFKDQFFSTIMKADSYFMKGGSVTLTPLPLDSAHISLCTAQMDLPYDSRPLGFTIYFGPNHYPTLKGYESGYEKIIPLGWTIFGWINEYAIIPLFNLLSGFMTNFGLIILVLTVIIKMVLFPLTFKSYLSTAKMRVLKPEIDALGEKFPRTDQAMQKQQATMETYRRAGVNPMGGCLPMLLQIPILIAMFNFFPASIELRQQSFLWASDLSAYDSVMSLPFNIPFYGDHVSLFTIFMCISLVVLTLWNNQTMTMPGAQQGVMKVMMWMMPVMMLFWFNNYASGLTYYYFVANTITIIQTWLIRRSVNDEEILQKLRANQKKPAPKSNIQQRLEAMAKRRQQPSQPKKK